MRDRRIPPPPSARQPLKGRGALGNPDCRYHAHKHEAVDDGWARDEPPPLQTTVTVETARTIISRNRSPDLPFEQSINAYRGCEHGCIYCYARPSHAYLGLSPGLDFESRLFIKPNAADVLRRELGRKGYVCKPIALGTNTDPYQPIEREQRITRNILEVLHDCSHPVSITTKSALIERDLDLLAALAERNLVRVQISLTTMDRALARLMEPRAAAPERRLLVMRRLSQAGITVTAMIAPVMPFLTDAELENLLEHSAAAGATHGGYIILRLPLELKGLFADWLEMHFPSKKKHVLSRLEEMHGGRLYDPSFGARQSGSGIFGELMRQRFRLAIRKLGLNASVLRLDTMQFQPPYKVKQLELF